MELRGSRGQDIHCDCGGQARINSRWVTEDLISMDPFLYTGGCRHLSESPVHSIGEVPCGRPNLSLQYCKPPKGWKLISGICAVRLNGGAIVGMSWLSRKFHQLELLIYCWESVKGGQLTAKVPQNSTAASEIFRSFTKSKLIVSKDNQLLSVCASNVNRWNIKWLLYCSYNIRVPY